jgi:hypothetical protein
MVVLRLITILLRLYINTIEGRRDIDSSFAPVAQASNLEYDCFTSRRDTDTQENFLYQQAVVVHGVSRG